MACSGAAEVPATTIGDDSDTVPASTATAPTIADPGTTTTVTTDTGSTTTTSDRPLAPDFTLELAEGGEYVLSEGTKPVYLVFWAEW